MQTCHVTTMGSPKSPGSVTIAIRYTSSPLQPPPPSRSGSVDSAENEPICWAKVGGENGAGEPSAKVVVEMETKTGLANLTLNGK